VSPCIVHYKEFANIQLDLQLILVIITTCDLLQCLVALNKSHKILVAKDNMWHQVAKVVAYRCNVTTLLWKSERMTPSLPKWGLGSLLGLLKFQSSIAGVKTPCIELFFISLESYQSVDVENGLAWATWTSTAQVMTKRKVGSQIGNLIPNH
jgi:hypothetical protein